MGVEEQDDLLREALASYAVHEPRTGIEERVLRRVRAPRLMRRSRWALAGLAAACVIMMMVPQQETLEILAPQIAAPLPVEVKAEVPRAIERPERFPTPSPLTREERALLTLADSTVPVASEPEEIAQIQIDAITIPPIGD